MAKKQKNILSTKRSIATAAKEIQSLLKKQIKKKITLKELKAMLAYLVDNYASVSYEKKVLTVRTEDIYRNGRNYGSYTIKINLQKLGKEKGYYYAITLSPRGEHHVYNDGRLCFGNGEGAAKKCVEDGRIDDFVDIVQQILRT